MDEKQYTELAVKLENIDSHSKSNEHRINSLENNMKGLQDTQISLIKIANSVENMGKSMVDVNRKVDQISEKQDKLNDKVTVLENKPAQETKKRWDLISNELLWFFIAGIAGFLLAQIFPAIF